MSQTLWRRSPIQKLSNPVPTSELPLTDKTAFQIAVRPVIEGSRNRDSTTQPPEPENMENSGKHTMSSTMRWTMAGFRGRLKNVSAIMRMPAKVKQTKEVKELAFQKSQNPIARTAP